jgi:hypothetical protein
MRRRDLLKYAGATALAAPFLSAARADQTTVKIGWDQRQDRSPPEQGDAFPAVAALGAPSQ